MLRHAPKSLTLSALLTLSTMLAPPALAEGETGLGAYLAARTADYQGDFSATLEYGARAIAEDPDNARILEGLTIAQLVLNPLPETTPYARRLAALDEQNAIARLVLLGDAFGHEKWDTALTLLEEGVSVGPLMTEMLRAWAELGRGQMSQALAVLDRLAEDEGTRGFAIQQKALATAFVGDFETAAQLMQQQVAEFRLNRRGVIAYVQILSQLDRYDEALEVLAQASNGVLDDELIAIIDTLKSKTPLPFTAVRTVQEGAAELFYLIANNIPPNSGLTSVLIYARIAEYLSPGLYDATLLTAQLHEDMGQHDLAVAAYARIPQDSPQFLQAALGRAMALSQSGRAEEAIGELRALSGQFPTRARIPTLLGEFLSREDRYEEARAAFDQAISLFEQDLDTQWRVYFQRAIVETKLDDWPAAEADFRKALALNPDQPNVLNYLGYSLVERREHLEEALDMIERAVAERPDSGYITDSLGWVYYRLGRYDEAVEQMERAVELLPVDPILNDHLGDTYWAVGRKREAEFQWKRALSFVTEDTDLEELNPERIRRKLELGLDQVLAEEGAAPLHGSK
ncbi:tetratricopeptide repeat protein [Aliiroseovarius crassostreae]|uniref:Tetratricopeptide repeat protein n=1 Tax=Aliiroseovarius crassostreae TaxID=154981 RepID=A0A9Q9H8F5_9RHOB|nr:tetratricopeptide repeat protein [Aliiroseovarius crassostreae]UWP94813.1 tetratricopeptide repeat protein [Aliiroseovarius crassostreae]